MTGRRTVLNRLARFGKSEDGAVLPLIGIAALVLVGVMGFAIDLGRAQLVHTKLLNSADAAGLAVGARLSTVADINVEAAKFVRANFPSGYADATITSVSASANELGDIITVNASARVPTTLMKLLGIQKVDVNVTSEVTRQTTGLELVLVLDTTGSMSDSMDELKKAARDLVNIVFGSDETAPNLYVGLVPFSQSVNVGPDRTSWIEDGAIESKEWGPSSWAGCVDARTTSNRDQADDPPSVAAFKPYYWADFEDDKDADSSANDWTWTEKTGKGQNKKTVRHYKISDTTGPECLLPKPGHAHDADEEHDHGRHRGHGSARQYARKLRSGLGLAHAVAAMAGALGR